jgi:tripartite-type tricarboxylate transporter receptor subunit TctC
MAGLKRRGFVAAMAGLALAPAVARAQAYPSKQVRVVVPYPAGGGTDLVARLIVPRLAERWRQTVIIDNKGGASGILGSDIVAKAAPDGYTLLVMTSAHTINPFTARQLPYDTERDFTPITVLVSGALTWSARPRRASTAWTSSWPPPVPSPASTSSAAPRTPRAWWASCSG